MNVAQHTHMRAHRCINDDDDPFRARIAQATLERSSNQVLLLLRATRPAFISFHPLSSADQSSTSIGTPPFLSDAFVRWDGVFSRRSVWGPNTRFLAVLIPSLQGQFRVVWRAGATRPPAQRRDGWVHGSIDLSINDIMTSLVEGRHPHS